MAGATDQAGCELVAQIAREHGQVQFQVLGSSMLPSVRPGDRLIVHTKDPSEIQPGGIILYECGGGLVAHRVVSRNGDEWVTRGDSMPKDDPPVRSKEIVGEIVAVVRRDRRVDLELTPIRRAAAWVLGRSKFSTRVMLKASRMEWRK